MRRIEFTKMQGAGNDYIYINAIKQQIENPSELAVKLSNRNFGIGSDGLVLILPSQTADFRMQMFNSDGSEAEMCGNASRCIAKFVHDKWLTDKTNITLETKSGIKFLELLEGNEDRRNVRVDMGEPILAPNLIPVNIKENPVLLYPIQVNNTQWNISCISMGNPHAIIFYDDIENLDLVAIGPLFEHHPLFPNRTNTEFAQIVDKKTIKMRVWERGAGETLACGTGACATAVAAVLNGLCDRDVDIHLKGGILNIKWDETTNHVFLTGEAVTVFEGEIV